MRTKIYSNKFAICLKLWIPIIKLNFFFLTISSSSHKRITK
jgi:hypothetical protein